MDLLIRKDGRAGRITLNRPQALNALTWDMVLGIEAALSDWRDDDTVSLVIIDAAGDKAFCAGGDIVEMHRTASVGDFAYGRRFWTDEYRLNARIADYPKPYVAFMQGFTMGGGVGVSCHGSHRVVCESSRITLPECGIGLVPDVGGSLLLARAPGRCGEYLGTTGARMGPADSLCSGFADLYLPLATWDEARAALTRTGNPAVLEDFADNPGPAEIASQLAEIDAHFGRETLTDIVRTLERSATPFAEATLTALSRVSPLAAAAAVELVRRVRSVDSIARALEMEYRFTYRSAEHGDFVEGIRAMVIDRDRNPKWRHADLHAVTVSDVESMLAPLGNNALNLEDAP